MRPVCGRLAGAARVEFLGWRTDEEIRALYQSAAMVLLPGVEDFGIVAVEAQACGTPVVAINEGGVGETIIDGVTGGLVREGAAALADGMQADTRCSTRAGSDPRERGTILPRELPATISAASVAEAQVRSRHDAPVQPAPRGVLRAQRRGARRRILRACLLGALRRPARTEGSPALRRVSRHAAVCCLAGTGRLPHPGHLSAAPRPVTGRRFLCGLRRHDVWPSC